MTCDGATIARARSRRYRSALAGQVKHDGGGFGQRQPVVVDRRDLLEVDEPAIASVLRSSAGWSIASWNGSCISLSAHSKRRSRVWHVGGQALRYGRRTYCSGPLVEQPALAVTTLSQVPRPIAFTGFSFGDSWLAVRYTNRKSPCVGPVVVTVLSRTGWRTNWLSYNH